MKLLFTFALILVCNFCDSAKILGVFTVPSISHQVVYQPIWKELSLRGHQVTVISPNILNDPKLTNLTEIDVGYAYELFKKYDISKRMSKDNYLIDTIMFAYEIFEELFELEHNHPDVKKILNDEEKDFDLVIVEALHPLVYGYGARFKAPIVGISSLGVYLNGHDAMGNPTHPVITPDILFPTDGEQTFWHRLSSTFYNVWYRLLYYGYLLPKIDKKAREYFGNDIPYIGDLEKNVSMMLLNVNPILHPIRANVPTIVELSQMHIKPKKKLPSDIQEFLDKSKEGIIYFSLGSNVKSANLTDNVREVITQALAELPYKVLWKWETDYLPGKPKNVITRKWLPQQDLLGHPNIKAFVTQGGIQSMEEAITNGVPLIGMPFFADQPLNVMKMIEMGIAKSVNFGTMTKDELRNTIIEVAENKMYRNNVKKIQKILTDQPMTGLEKAIFWIEYVIRHDGAPHLRSPAANMPWIQYFLVDVIAFVIFVTSLLLYSVYQLYIFAWAHNNGKHKMKTH